MRHSRAKLFGELYRFASHALNGRHVLLQFAAPASRIHHFILLLCAFDMWQKEQNIDAQTVCYSRRNRMLILDFRVFEILKFTTFGENPWPRHTFQQLSSKRSRRPRIRALLTPSSGVGGTWLHLMCLTTWETTIQTPDFALSCLPQPPFHG